MASSGFPPKAAWLQRFDIEIMPPGEIIIGLMQFLMMVATKWNGKFVADAGSEKANMLSRKQAGLDLFTATMDFGYERLEQDVCSTHKIYSDQHPRCEPG
jgi:hypothetical protein